MLEAVAGGLVGGLLRDDDDDKHSYAHQAQPTNISLTEWREPWAPTIPYLTGTGMLPEYLSRPIPTYNPEWLRWSDMAAKGMAQGPPPPQFLFDNRNQGYGGIARG